ncbi:MAG: hypothetical protein A2Z21_10550 [Candidatus Fraserbacteria bacterium RBG_16_55_9]|uniref:Uncharacterized protein n=1 Tax=Fraserbacteria sp. (strain RBG_16_55_9) TaxID=1817864 RepID=A0A1F5UPX3_FRAXR|nr:MAG: hypothetical protein A2Z21_10550 [Candidatus Fraserbacteria bacterium RBG_16_55_9]
MTTKIDEARDAFSESVRLFPGSRIPIYGHNELEALLAAVREEEREACACVAQEEAHTHEGSCIEAERDNEEENLLWSRDRAVVARRIETTIRARANLRSRS